MEGYSQITYREKVDWKVSRLWEVVLWRRGG
jgi:hypothetical protein